MELLQLTLLIVTISCCGLSCLALPQQLQYQYGLPSPAFAPAPVHARAPAPFAFAPAPAPPQVPAPPPEQSRFFNSPVLDDSRTLELLPPLQHVVGTRYPAVRPSRGYRFPLSQLLNPTPPPNLKH